MGDPNDEVILLNPDDEFVNDVVDDWAMLIEAKSGSSSFDIKDSTLEFRLFPDNTFFTKGPKANKREIRRRIKTILDNCTFPEEQKRKAAECYAENPEYMHLPIDKLDPRKHNLFDVVDEGFVSVSDLENKGMLKSINDVELNWNIFNTYKDLNFLSKQGRVLDKEIEGSFVKRIPSRRPRPKPATPAKKGTLKNREEDNDFYPERERDLASERKRRESENERKRREKEQDFEQQQERIYEMYKTSQRKREQDLTIQCQFKIKDPTNSRAQNFKPQQSERHHQNRSGSSYQNHRRSSPNRKERERERRRDKSPESPRYHHKKSKRRNRDRDRSSSSERSIFSPSSTSSIDEIKISKRHFSSKKSPEKRKISSPPARRKNDDIPREQFNSKKSKKIEEIISIFSDDSSEKSPGYSIPVANKKTNPPNQNRRNSSHINVSSLESIPEETQPDSEEREVFEITGEENREIARIIEEKINRNTKLPQEVKKYSSEEIVKVQSETIIPSSKYPDEENDEIAQLMEENINKGRNNPKLVKFEDDLFSQYRQEMGQLIQEIIHKEFQQIGKIAIGKHHDEEYEDLGRILEEKINKSKAPPQPIRVEEEDFSTQFKKAMAQMNQNSSPNAEIIEEREDPNEEEDTRDLAQLLEEKIHQSKKSPQNKKSDKNYEVDRPLLMHDLIEDHSQDIYDPELAQIIEEKMNKNRNPSQPEKVADNDQNLHETKSIQSCDNSPLDNSEMREECPIEQDDLELTQLLEEKINASRNSSQHQKANKDQDTDQEKPGAQEQPIYRCSSDPNERIEESILDPDGIQEKIHQSENSGKITEDSHILEEKELIYDQQSVPQHHSPEVIEEDGEIFKENVCQNKDSSPHKTISQDDHSHQEKYPTQSHHKKSPNHYHHHDSQNKKIDEKTEHKSQQDGVLNFILKVEYGKSNFTSDTKASADDQLDFLNRNRFSQENSEVLVIDDDDEVKEDEEQFNSVDLVISDKGDLNDSEVEEIDISEIQSQELDKKIIDLKLTSPEKNDSKILTLGTTSLPPKEIYYDQSHQNNSELSHPPPLSLNIEPNFPNNPTQTFMLPQGTQPIDFRPPQFLNPMNPMGNYFGGPFRAPGPFQYSPLIFFSPPAQSFGPNNVFAGNFMPPPQMQPFQQFLPCRNNSDRSNQNSGSANQE